MFGLKGILCDPSSSTWRPGLTPRRVSRSSWCPKKPVLCNSVGVRIYAMGGREKWVKFGNLQQKWCRGLEGGFGGVKEVKRHYVSYVSSVSGELESKLLKECEKQEKEGESLFISHAASEFITLTSQERKLFDLLKAVVNAYCPAVELRVAGGWVRDKILGLASGDVDLTVDLMSGASFCALLEQYLASLDPSSLSDIGVKGMTAKKDSTDSTDSIEGKNAFKNDSNNGNDKKYGNGESSSGNNLVSSKKSIHSSPPRSGSSLPHSVSLHHHHHHPLSVTLTKLNPQQSKHLETAIVTLYGLELNFAQLRTDTYDEQSRIPQIKRASAEEDAHRRDFTINALFYNILTDSIEDYTGAGIRSILSQEVRTPLPPLETLKDDPLRALRAIRFAARFGFSIHPELRRCIEDPHVHLLLLTKVTPPRVGLEVQKMLAPFIETPFLSSDMVNMPPKKKNHNGYQKAKSTHINNIQQPLNASPTSPSPPLSRQSLSNQNLGVSIATERYNNPIHALRMLVESGLYIPVLNPVSWQQSAHPIIWTQEMAEHGLLLCEYLHHIFAEVDQNRAEVNQNISSKVRSALLAMTFLLPLLGSSYHDLLKQSNRTNIPWLNAFKHSLQYPLSNIFFTAQALAGASTAISFLDRMILSPKAHVSGTFTTHFFGQQASNPKKTENDKKIDPAALLPILPNQDAYTERFIMALALREYREEVGMWLRSAPSFWRSMILLTKLYRTPFTSNESQIPKEFSAGWLLKEFPLELGFIEAIEQTQMDRARNTKLYFNGHQLSQLLCIEPGPKVGNALDLELRFQVSHLDASETEVKNFLQNRFQSRSSASL